MGRTTSDARSQSSVHRGSPASFPRISARKHSARLIAPSLLSASGPAARSRTRALGLRVVFVCAEPHPDEPGGLVVAQIPAAGSRMRPGDPVALLLAGGDASRVRQTGPERVAPPRVGAVAMSVPHRHRRAVRARGPARRPKEHARPAPTLRRRTLWIAGGTLASLLATVAIVVTTLPRYADQPDPAAGRADRSGPLPMRTRAERPVADADARERAPRSPQSSRTVRRRYVARGRHPSHNRRAARAPAATSPTEPAQVPAPAPVQRAPSTAPPLTPAPVPPPSPIPPGPEFF